jgi:O-antigen ligase
MSNTAITYLVAASSGVCGLAAYVAFILVPAWTSYSRMWERCAAAFLTLYVVGACLGLGLVGGGAIVWFWDRIQG